MHIVDTDVRCPHPSTTGSSPGYISRTINKRNSKHSPSPPRAAAVPTTLPSIGSGNTLQTTLSSAGGNSPELPRAKILGHASSLPLEQAIPKQAAAAAARPYVAHSSSVAVGEYSIRHCQPDVVFVVLTVCHRNKWF